MNVLVTLAHGAEHFRLEAVYSVLSFLRTAGMAADRCTVVVVTDMPSTFRRYLGETAQVRYVEVDRGQLESWRGGPGGYVHRIKPQAILHAGRCVDAQPADALLFVDSDTAFTAPAVDLFARIAAGEAVFLHTREGTIAGNRRHSRSQGRLYAASRRHMFTLGGRPQRLAPELPLWNSGVIGLRGDQLSVLAETLALTDEITAAVPLPAAEQVALSAVLAQRGLPVEAATPWVLHYHLFKEFRADLAAFFIRHAGATPDQLLVRLDEIDPAARMAPKLAFNRLPKWWRQVRKAVGRPWQPLPYPWTHAPSPDTDPRRP